jgi:hypothetical protein
VEEHAGQERPVVIDREADLLGPGRVGVACRDDAEEVEEPFEVLRGSVNSKAKARRFSPISA